jgi:hypothetical protein
MMSDSLGKSSISDRAQYGKWIKAALGPLFLHERPGLCDENKVCEKVELYDFKWSAFREATRFIMFLFLS